MVPAKQVPYERSPRGRERKKWVGKGQAGKGSITVPRAVSLYISELMPGKRKKSVFARCEEKTAQEDEYLPSEGAARG